MNDMVVQHFFLSYQYYNILFVSWLNLNYCVRCFELAKPVNFELATFKHDMILRSYKDGDKTRHCDLVTNPCTYVTTENAIA